MRALLERKVADLDNLRRELRRILDSWMPRVSVAASSASTSRAKEVIRHGESLTLPSLHGLPRGRHGGDTIRIGEDENIVVLKKAEWNVLVDAIKSGRVGRV